MRISKRRQQGYMAVLAVLLILVIGIISTTTTQQYFSAALTTAKFAQGQQALYVAESGFEEAARLVLTPRLSGTNSRIACSAITGTASLTNTGAGSGTFTATTV